MEPLLQVKNIAKEFPGVKALEDISIDFYPGECHALVGENGAGKSTLIKIIASIYKPTRGEVILDGKVCNFKTPKDALDAGIAVIEQETAIAPHLTVAENMYLGCEPKKANGLLDRKKMEADAQAVLDEMGLDVDAHTLCSKLTAAQLQMVEIAKALSSDCKVLIFDEPTSSLNDEEAKGLFEIIHRLASQGIGIFYISHKMEEIFDICNTITIMRDGQKIETIQVKDTNPEYVVSNMVGKELGNLYPEKNKSRGEEVLRVEGLTRKPYFSNVSFSTYKGEILGLCGLVGAGRT